MDGLYLTIEGLDGCGKSTLATGLADWLRTSTGRMVVLTREPGGTGAGGRIRDILRSYGDRLSDLTVALLFMADRTEHHVGLVAPELETGSVVVSDRGLWSTLAYQGRAVGVDEGFLHICHARIGSDVYGNPCGLWPSIVVYVDTPIDLARGRAIDRDGGIDWYDRKPLSFWVDLQAAYGELAAAWASEATEVVVVDGSLSPEEVLSQACSMVEETSAFLERFCRV